MVDPAAIVASSLGRFPAAPCVVAFSGGIDSTVLLHLARDVATAGVRAVHVDHGLHPDSSRWAARAEEVAASLGVECETIRIDVVDDGQGREAAARAARYDALAAVLRPGELLLTAHHADDQAETVLLALMRGSGPPGLAAMPASTPLGAGVLLRPLLGVRRAAIEAWARDHRLQWTDDPSNTDTTLARNHLRHVVLPDLESYWPEAVAALSLAARWAAEADGLLTTLARMDIDALSDGATLDAEGVVALGADRARNLLRVWLSDRGLPSPPYTRLDEAVRQIAEAGADRTPAIDWPGAVLRRWDGRLYAAPPEAPLDDGWSAEWDGRTALALPAGLGALSLVDARQGLDPAQLAGRKLTVSFRQGGERLRVHAGGPHRQLKHLLAEACVPPWERGRIPLLSVDGALVAVGELFVDADWAAVPGLAVVVTRP